MSSPNAQAWLNLSTSLDSYLLPQLGRRNATHVRDSAAQGIVNRLNVALDSAAPSDYSALEKSVTRSLLIELGSWLADRVSTNGSEKADSNDNLVKIRKDVLKIYAQIGEVLFYFKFHFVFI